MPLHQKTNLLLLQQSLLRSKRRLAVEQFSQRTLMEQSSSLQNQKEQSENLSTQIYPNPTTRMP